MNETENDFQERIRRMLQYQGITAYAMDGKVDEQVWDDIDVNKVKMLFLLKEPVGDSHKSFSLLDFLKNDAPRDGDQTWRNVARWVYAVLHQMNSTDRDRYEKEVKRVGNRPEECRKWLHYIVAINLKKQLGASHTNTRRLESEFKEHYHEVLVEQLKRYADADIIVCCGDGVWHCLKGCYREAFGKEMNTSFKVHSDLYADKYRCFVSDDTPCVMNFWHPAAVKKSWYKCSKFVAVVTELMQKRGGK